MIANPFNRLTNPVYARYAESIENQRNNDSGLMLDPETNYTYETSAFFPRSSDDRYHMQVKVMSGNGTCMHEVDCMTNNSIPSLADTGSDLVLFTRDVADALGYDLDRISDNLAIGGIHGNPTEFKQIDTWIQIGNMKPMFAPIAFSTTEDGLVESLFGAKGTYGKGNLEAVFDRSGVTFRIKRPNVLR